MKNSKSRVGFYAVYVYNIDCDRVEMIFNIKISDDLKPAFIDAVNNHAFGRYFFNRLVMQPELKEGKYVDYTKRLWQ